MPSLRYTALLPLLALACGGRIDPSAPVAGAASTSSEAPVATGPTSRATREPTSHASASATFVTATAETYAPTTTGASSSAMTSYVSSSTASTAPSPPTPSEPIFSGATYVSGAIGTDGKLVFWVEESSSGVDQLVSCPVTGCSAPSVFWTSAGWGGSGSLLVTGGRVYFQAASDGSGWEPVLTCPVSGCGAGPSTFVAEVKDSAFSPALTTDGQNLLWVSNGSVYGCPLGDTCAAPSVLATLAPKAEVSALAVTGSTVYWVDERTSRVESVPVGGGPVSEYCTAPGAAANATGPGDVAVVGGYAYVSGVTGSYDTVGIYRCALADGANGQATEYAHDIPAADLVTDGTSLLWMNIGNGPQGGSYGVIRSCAAGATCPAWTDVGAPISEANHNAGFTIFGGDVYSAGVAILRTGY